MRSHTGLLLGGRYRLLSPLGEGGTAVVWQAHDHVLARTVAVKMMVPQQAVDARARDRIRIEARAAAELSHPNIAQVHDHGDMESDGQIFPYVVMELVPGDTLLQRLAAGPVAPQFAMRVGAEIAAALAAAHAEGLVHRDITPANVMLAPTGAKVVDFGIAAALSPGPPVPASDVYALGIVLRRMLTGPGVPDYVIGLCNRCLAEDPARRPSAQEAAAVLAHGAGLRVVTEVQPAASEATVLIPQVTAVSPGRSGRRMLWAGAAVAVLLVALAGGWLLRDDPDRVVPDASAVATAGAAIPPVPPAAPRTLTSAAGTIEATCPSPAAAQILSWHATKPYRFRSADPGPAPFPAVTFQHGKTLITMTVTCTGGEPALS